MRIILDISAIVKMEKYGWLHYLIMADALAVTIQIKIAFVIEI